MSRTKPSAQRVPRGQRGWGRRLVTKPALVALALASVLVAPALLPAAAVWDVVTRNRIVSHSG